MLIRAYSDLHGRLPHVDPCDLLLIAGDVCPIGGARYGDHETTSQAKYLKEIFNPWCEVLPAPRIVMTPGNHDAVLDARQSQVPYELSPKVTMLIDEGIQLPKGGPSIFGAPWIPFLATWPFYLPDDELQLRAATLPDGFDIWLFHGPPKYEDALYDVDLTISLEHAGNPFVIEPILEKKPQVLVCGHIHEGFGDFTLDETVIMNVAFLNHRYAPQFRHYEIDWHSTDGEVKTFHQIEDRVDPRGLWWDCLAAEN